jgi:hypothetical protein
MHRMIDGSFSDYLELSAVVVAAFAFRNARVLLALSLAALLTMSTS